MRLSTCIRKFFIQYLPQIKGSSIRSVKSYRDAFKIFISFAAQYYSIKVSSLRVDHLTSDLVLDFLIHLESERGNTARTRNHRLAAIKSLAKMIRFMYPENRKIAERILNIPQKRTQKQLIGFLYHEEVLDIYESIDLRQNEGFRDYTILHLLYDSGARASEIATLNLGYFDPKDRTLVILGKGNRYRKIELKLKTVQLIKRYISKYRTKPKPLYRHRLFTNQRAGELTRHGIYRLCRKYITKTLCPKRLKDINPAHSFRHSCAVRMLTSGDALTDIKNRLGHESIESTMIYLQMDLLKKQDVQKKFVAYTQSIIAEDPKIDELIDWENEEDLLSWLDSL